MIVYVVYNNDADKTIASYNDFYDKNAKEHADEKLKEEQKKNPKDWIVVSDLYYPDFTR